MAPAGHDPARRLGPAAADLSNRGFGFDAVYVAVGRAVTAVAMLVVRLDRDVVDAYPRGTASLTGIAGRLGERAHRATPSVGLVAVVVGVVLVAVAGVTVWS
jgi:NADH-quinone oxidoreductase subunit L